MKNLALWASLAALSSALLCAFTGEWIAAMWAAVSAYWSLISWLQRMALQP